VKVVLVLEGLILGKNFDVTIGRAACEAWSVTWNLGTNSAFALDSRKIMENFDQVGWLQDLLDTKWLLASSQALNMGTLTLAFSWMLLYLKRVYIFIFTIT
jgi:hypothetical protein